MDAGTMQRMFDPFFTTREIGEGSGLGLAMIYGIVKNHNGHITCDSAPGGGTCFKVYIPAVRQARSAARPSAQAESRSFTTSGSETILVVDDEAVILDLAETILGRFGYRVIRAENGEQALDVMARKGDHVDLVILDLNMPGMGGNSCLQTLKKRHPGVPVLVASGYSPDGSAHETVAAGAAGFIGKPFQIKDMLKAVRDIFDTR
jgi:CheY-like chemotaxis protein